MMTNRNFSNGYMYFDTMFIYAGNKFLMHILHGKRFQANRVLIHSAITSSLVHYF